MAEKAKALRNDLNTERSVKDILAKVRVVSRKDVISEAQRMLDKYCKVFGASSYQDLVLRADRGEIPFDTATDILDYYASLGK